MRNKDLTGKQAEEALQAADITVNKNMVPFDDKSPFVTSGIRLGTPAMTTRGLAEPESVVMVQWIDRVLSRLGDEQVLQQVRGEVKALTADFPLYDFVLA